MKWRPLRARRVLRAAGLVGIVTAVTLILAPAATESSTHSRLVAYVAVTNRGPVPACSPDGSDCTSANFVRSFIYVVNANPLTNMDGTRENMPNAFVVSSVDQTVFVDGVQEPAFTFTFIPPPNPFTRGFSGNWPSTVTCTPGAPPPCNVVGSPAIDPGEVTAILHSSFFHARGEPNGTYVFRLTVHGTLNGTPVDLTASGPPIRMTD